MQDFLKNNPVSDDLVKAEYERIKATVTGTEYQAAHILVATESEANDIIATLKEDPGAFAKLAKERSKDAGSKDQGGDLGWLDLSVIAPEFGAAVSKLDKGTFTQAPVQTSTAITSSCWKTPSRSRRRPSKRSSPCSASRFSSNSGKSNWMRSRPRPRSK